MVLFFALTYLVTWACFFGAAAVPASSPFATLLLFIGTFAPAFVAIGLIARESAVPGLQLLARRVGDFRASWRWYAFAIGYIAVLKLVTAVAYRAIEGRWPAFGTTPWFVVLVAIVLSTPVQAGEEIGWRGYALPRLAERFGYRRASLLLGVSWGCWHLPLFLLPAHPNFGQPFWNFVLGSTALSVAMAWLFVNTNGSIGLAMLMHSALNQTNGIVPTRRAGPGNPMAIDTSLIMVLFAVLLTATAVCFLFRLPAGLKPRPTPDRP